MKTKNKQAGHELKSLEHRERAGGLGGFVLWKDKGSHIIALQQHSMCQQRVSEENRWTSRRVRNVREVVRSSSRT